MSSTYKIKEVADRSGFTPATLRYYEEIGLLQETSRNAAGYRLYTDAAIERLAFIARAKHLGCTLHEISGLTLAWSGGQCGPVQDGLRSVVAEKLAIAQRQIVELTTLINDLREAAAQLETHRPEGACDDQCGCIAEPTTPDLAAGQRVVLGTKPDGANGQPPAGCTLPKTSAEERVEDWQLLLTYAVERETLDRGARVAFGPDTPLNELMRLVSAEQDCCQFFEFVITVDTRGTALEVSTTTDALPFLHMLFGVNT